MFKRLREFAEKNRERDREYDCALKAIDKLEAKDLRAIAALAIRKTIK